MFLSLQFFYTSCHYHPQAAPGNLGRTYDEEAQYQKVALKTEKFGLNSYISGGIDSSIAENIHASKSNARISTRYGSQSSILEHDVAVILVDKDSLSISNGNHSPHFIEGAVSSRSKEDTAIIGRSQKIIRTDRDARETIDTVNEIASKPTNFMPAKRIKKKSQSNE